MARIARVVVPGYQHHVTQRGYRRQQTQIKIRVASSIFPYLH
jgi:hypothetical protein